ncbi:sensor histidine kinase [Actinacidiphila acidipaludis]|uniref:histidine kinase n=1 Tax=Actinacidiphila acidipaludis TaxID=2873382 RepID=A0ABS7Q6Z8_9ACTN|nr:histidine kinase [Streptomyces acidipaludis]MBY8878933.1 sensor histidine kinase [Streptomyces acidipaludis]
MLRTAIWMARMTAVVLVGLSVFPTPPHGPVAFPVTVAGFAVSLAAVACWAFLDVRKDLADRHPRRLPAVLTVLVVASSVPCTLLHAGAMVALATMAVVEAGTGLRLVHGWAVFAAGALTLAAGSVVNAPDRASVIGYPLLLLVGLLMGHNRRAYRVQAEQSAALVGQLRQLRTEQRRVAVLDERARIAREIHDVLAHSLGALGIQIQAARALLAEGADDPARAGQADGVLAVAQRIASDGLAETRRAVHALRADTPPLDEELARMAAVHEERHGAVVTAEVSGPRADLPAEATLALVRTAQESLVNAAKHAPRRPVTLRLVYGDDDVTLTVGNPLGSGVPDGFATLDGGYGLTGMRERLLLLGGTLTAGPHRSGPEQPGAPAPEGPAPEGPSPEGPSPEDASPEDAGKAGATAYWTVTARVPR